MGRLSRLQSGLLPLCAIGLCALTVQAKIPRQDKPVPASTKPGAARPPADLKPVNTNVAPPSASTPVSPPRTNGASATTPPSKPEATQPQAATTSQVASTPPLTVVVQQPPAPQQDASSGWIGILIAVALGYAGFRFAQNKGFTVVGMLTKAGVTLPKDPDPVPQAQRPGNTATALPPLPGLDTLPSPTPGTAAQTPNIGVMQSGPLVLVATDGQAAGKRFPLHGLLSIGRDPGCDIALSNDQTISRSHAEVQCTTDGRVSVTDKGSSNGTFLNGTRVNGTVDVTSGDTLVCGAQRFRIEVDA